MTDSERRKRNTERVRIWRANHPEQARAAVARYRRKNADELRKKYRDWKAKNPDVAKAATARWRAANPERVRHNRNRWYAEHREQVRAARKAKYAADPKAVSLPAKERRDAVKLLILGLHGSQCADCGFADVAALDFHHVRGDKVRNVSAIMNCRLERILSEAKKCVVLCSNCHRIRHSLSRLG